MKPLTKKPLEVQQDSEGLLIKEFGLFLNCRSFSCRSLGCRSGLGCLRLLGAAAAGGLPGLFRS